MQQLVKSLSFLLNIHKILKGLTADAADPDLVAFEHAFDTDHVIDRVIDPMIDRMIDRVIELDDVSAIVRRPLIWTIDR